MAAEQQHGKSFERLVIDRSGYFPRAEGIEFGHIDEFDIPADHTEDGIPVSVKSKKSNPWASGQPSIEMSDALRFFRNSTTGSMRIIAGLYRHEDDQARFYEIHELQLAPCMKRWLWGDLEETDIAEFVAKIQAWSDEDDAAGLTKRDRARANARRYKSRRLCKTGFVSLNQKISTTNKRLQCSINLFHLRRICEETGFPTRIITDEDDNPMFGNLRLPLAVQAGARSRRAA